jgi:hypothetical protein
MSKARYEQTKLLAGPLNAVAGAVIVTGVVAPLVAVSFGVAASPAVPAG